MSKSKNVAVTDKKVKSSQSSELNRSDRNVELQVTQNITAYHDAAAIRSLVRGFHGGRTFCPRTGFH